jgi:hypothetical protein
VTDGLVAGPPVRVGPCTVVAVDRVWLRAEDGRRGRWAAGGREPVAVVVRDGSGTRALDMGGGEVGLDALLEQVDGLAAVLGTPTQGGKA